MKYKTRNTVYTAIAAAVSAAILVSFLLTCALHEPDNYVNPAREYPGEYPPGREPVKTYSLTLYLDDFEPAGYSRALNLPLAILGHDLFEVAFYHPNSGVIARAAWETGHTAGVKGVYRGQGGTGVDYRYATVPAVTANPDAVANPGAALLFVGKKSDRTLLAVGKLTHVDGVESTLINANSRTVTFSVYALRAGVSSKADSSSFTTDAKVATIGNQDIYTFVNQDNTDVINITVGVNPFPLFRIDADASGNEWVHGEYKFDVVTNDFDTTYRNGILQKSNIELAFEGTVGGTNYRRVPRYPVGDNKWATNANNILQPLELDTSTPDPVVGNNAAAGAPFNNPVQFRIGRTVGGGNNGKVFAFSFQIPVYPLINNGRADGFSWYVRPGYDSYLYDLDDGMGGSGGSILIGTGQFVETFSNSLFVRKPPDKTRYNGTGANPWLLDLYGIEVYLRTVAGTKDISDASYLKYVIGTGNNRVSIEGGQNIQILFQNNNKNGVVTIRLECYGPPPFNQGSNGPPYDPTTGARNTSYNGDSPYEGEFTLYYFPIPAGVTLAMPENSHRFIITNDEDWRGIMNNKAGANPHPWNTGGTFLVVFFKGFNIGDVLTFSGSVRRNIIFLAGEPDVIVGKSIAGATGVAFADNGAGNMYYFGVWPFDEILSAQGMAFESHPFTINTAGTWQDVANATGDPPVTTTRNGYFIGSGANRVDQNMGVTFVNEDRLLAPYP